MHIRPQRLGVAIAFLLVSLPTVLQAATGQLTTAPTSVNFGSVQVGTSQSETIQFTNSGAGKLDIVRVSASGAGFGFTGAKPPIILQPGQSSTFTLTFSPGSSGVASGSLTVSTVILISSSGQRTYSSATVPLTGTGVALGTLSATPLDLNFGTVQVGQTATEFEALTNSGGSSVTISQASVSGAGFSISGLTLPLTLTAGASVTFSAEFAPVTGGSASGTVAITSDASDTLLDVSLSGAGSAIGVLNVNPPTLAFGNVVVGTSATLPATLSATGSAVTVTSDTLSSSVFGVSGISLPLTIAPGQSVSLTVSFTPQSTGSTTGSATVSSNASNSPGLESLSGAGIAPPPHTADLSWAGDGSQVSGYNVYRGNISGGPYSKINSALDPVTTYADSTVVDGLTYYYVTTAVNSSGTESTYSNETQAIIPPP